MTARWDAMPTKAREKVGRAAPARGTWRCGGVLGCGLLLEDVTWAAALRHADTHGGGRLETV